MQDINAKHVHDIELLMMLRVVTCTLSKIGFRLQLSFSFIQSQTTFNVESCLMIGKKHEGQLELNFGLELQIEFFVYTIPE